MQKLEMLRMPWSRLVYKMGAVWEVTPAEVNIVDLKETVLIWERHLTEYFFYTALGL